MSKKSYSIELKQEAARLYADNKTCYEIAKTLGVSKSTVAHWVNTYSLWNKTDKNELELLRNKIKQLEEENYILKKTISILVNTPCT